MNQAVIDAEDFVLKYSEKLKKASELLPDTDVSVTCVFDDESLYKKWDEGLVWFENIIRKFTNCKRFSK